MKEVIKLRRKIKIWVICKSSYNAINNHSRINSSIDMHASLYVNIVLINTRLSIQILRHLIYIYIYIYYQGITFLHILAHTGLAFI